MGREFGHGNGLFQIIKGVGFALACSLVATFILAVVLRVCVLPDRVIYPINQTIKALAVAIGTLCFVREEKGIWKGLGIGLLFSALSYLTFSALGGDFTMSAWIIAELALSAFIGIVCGIIAVNLKKSG